MPLTRPQFFRAAVFSCSIVVAGMLQVSLLNALPWVPLQLNLPVSLAMYGTLAFGWRLPLFWAVGVGLFQDLYTLVGFGVHAWSLVVCVTVVYLSAQQWVTDRTTTALLALGLAGSVAYHTFFPVVSWVYQIFTHSEWLPQLPWGAADFVNELSHIGLELAVLLFLSFAWRNPRWGGVVLERR